MELLVPKKGLPSFPKVFFLLKIFANITITSMVLMVMLADVVTMFYQTVFFGVNQIPKIQRGKYVVMNRHNLGKLNWVQKWNCWYCEYVNGVLAWIKAVANQTEVYSCAIKYTHHYEGQEYQSGFYAPQDFEERNK